MSNKIRHNEPGAPVNTPQHLVGQEPKVAAATPETVEQVKLDPPEETMQGLDRDDPHPAEEGKPYSARHPGGAHPPSPTKDIGPNPAVHNGEPPDGRTMQSADPNRREIRARLDKMGPCATSTR